MKTTKYFYFKNQIMANSKRYYLKKEVLVSSEDILRLFKVSKNKLVKSKSDISLKTRRINGQNYYTLSDILQLLSNYMNKQGKK